MTRKQLLLLLVLLMTAATGAWAQTSDKETPLTLQAAADGKIYIYDPKEGMKYKVGDGDKQTVTGTSDVTIDVTAGQTVQFFGNGTEITAYSGEQGYNFTKFNSSVPCCIYGNIMSLVDEEGFATATELTADYAFYLLFAGFSNLSNHPSRKLVLPATTLTKRCYSDMFSSCTGLTTAPALPATKLAEQCYSNMFGGCTGLTTAPALPATELATKCYYNMFKNCTSLTTAPLLPAPTLTKQCYNWMFYGCTNLNAVTCLATNISAEGATGNWLKGVAATGTLTIVKGTEDKWAANSVDGIPSGWTTDLYGYKVKLAAGTADAGNWTATLGSSTTPQSLPVYTNRGDAVTLTYGGRLKVKSVTATHDGWNGDLSSIPASALEADGQTLIVPDGATLKGELDVSTIPYKVVIPAGATVTLKGVTIEGESNDAYKWAGITCEGDATIILADNSTNTVKGFYEKYPGIHVPTGKKLTIQGGSDGNGKLTASSNGRAAGIGAGYAPLFCGNIEIQGGDITATGGRFSAGIGGGPGARCGLITISGGTVTATGGPEAAGIGSGNQPGADCGAITISGGTVKATGGENAAGIGSGSGGGVNCGPIFIIGGTVEAIGSGYGAGIGSGLNAACGDILIIDGVTMTSVTATKGSDAPYSIGAGGYSDSQSSTCGTVTIGEKVYWENNAAVDEAAATYLAQATIVYPSPFANVTAEDRGKMIGSDGKVYDPDAIPAGTTAVAMIVYVGEPGSADASSSTYKGLALALDEGGIAGAVWGDYSGTCLPTQYSDRDDAKTDMNGIANTNTLVSTDHSEHDHFAASTARGYNEGKHPVGTSEWFLPSAGQWNKMGSTFNFETIIDGYTPMITGQYWSSTEIDASNAYWFNLSPSSPLSTPGLESHSKDEPNGKVRACIAF